MTLGVGTRGAGVLLFLLALASARPAAGAGECTPASLRRAFAEDRPAAIAQVAEIPAPVLDAFWRAYGDSDPSRRIADPNQPFQATDLVQKELPWRRLIAAAASPRAAFVLYEKGGRAKTRHLFLVCLADGAAQGAYSSLRAPTGYDPTTLAAALRDGCLVSPPREYAQPSDQKRCPPLPAPDVR